MGLFVSSLSNIKMSDFFLKICCEELQTVMVPLPDCASGEWGPTKATRLFGLIPITHQVIIEVLESSVLDRSGLPFFQEPLIFAGRGVELQFRMSRPLTDFMATLHKNGIEEKKMSKYVQHNVVGDTITFNIRYLCTSRHGLIGWNQNCFFSNTFFGVPSNLLLYGSDWISGNWGISVNSHFLHF